MRKIFYYDLETTGVELGKHAIHQIAGLVEIDGKVKDTITLDVRPWDGAELNPGALAVAHKSEVQIMNGLAPSVALLNLKNVLGKHVNSRNRTDKFFLCGYNNARFDDLFLRDWFTRCGDKYFGSWFWANSLDVMVLATWHLLDQRPAMVDFKLATVAKRFDIKTEAGAGLHDALTDVWLTRGIYDKICVGHSEFCGPIVLGGSDPQPHQPLVCDKVLEDCLDPQSKSHKGVFFS